MGTTRDPLNKSADHPFIATAVDHRGAVTGRWSGPTAQVAMSAADKEAHPHSTVTVRSDRTSDGTVHGPGKGRVEATREKGKWLRESYPATQKTQPGPLQMSEGVGALAQRVAAVAGLRALVKADPGSPKSGGIPWSSTRAGKAHEASQNAAWAASQHAAKLSVAARDPKIQNNEGLHLEANFEAAHAHKEAAALHRKAGNLSQARFHMDDFRAHRHRGENWSPREEVQPGLKKSGYDDRGQDPGQAFKDYARQHAERWATERQMVEPEEAQAYAQHYVETYPEGVSESGESVDHLTAYRNWKADQEPAPAPAPKPAPTPPPKKSRARRGPPSSDFSGRVAWMHGQNPDKKRSK